MGGHRVHDPHALGQLGRIRDEACGAAELVAGRHELAAAGHRDIDYLEPGSARPVQNASDRSDDLLSPAVGDALDDDVVHVQAQQSRPGRHEIEVSHD